jgi:hypothetical protein
MKMCVCSIFDHKVEAYGPVQLFRAVGEASRSFVQACTDQKQNFVTFPDDFSLRHIGYFDTETGKTENIEPNTIMTPRQALNTLYEMSQTKLAGEGE